jgi:hypothetical protein
MQGIIFALPAQSGFAAAFSAILQRGNLASHLQQLPRLGVSWRGAAVFAGGDSGQRGYLPPAIGGARGGEFFADGAVEFFRVQRAVFADGILKQQIEDRARRVTKLPIPRRQSGGVGLQVAADGFVQLV